MALDVLTRERLQHLLGHAEVRAWIELLLIQVVAVATVEVANRAPRLEHYMVGLNHPLVILGCAVPVESRLMRIAAAPASEAQT